jgi:F-type H+-transporting ATPase subunit beta
VVARARRLERFLTQPFFTTEQFTGLKGKLVSREEALDGCERILRDEFKDHPERALYMIGGVEEAKAKAKSGRAGDEDSSDSDSGNRARSNPISAASAKPRGQSETPPTRESKSESVPGHAGQSHES